MSSRRRSGRGRSSGGGDQRTGGRNRRKRGANVVGTDYWGEDLTLPEPVRTRAASPRPDAVVASLGRPPLGDRSVPAEAYFAAVYGRASALAGALAVTLDDEDGEEVVDGTGGDDDPPFGA